MSWDRDWACRFVGSFSRRRATGGVLLLKDIQEVDGKDDAPLNLFASSKLPILKYPSAR
jgi:hypothetical protein